MPLLFLALASSVYGTCKLSLMIGLRRYGGVILQNAKVVFKLRPYQTRVPSFRAGWNLILRAAAMLVLLARQSAWLLV